MKILIANWVYGWGSTGYIVQDLKNQLERLGHDVIVAAAQNKDTDESCVYVFSKPSVWKWFRRFNRLGFVTKFQGSRLASKRLIRLIEEVKPDLVNLHLLHCSCLNLYYLLENLGKSNIKTVMTNHAELYYTGSCGHSYDCNKWYTSECRHCINVKESTNSMIFGNPHRNWMLMHRAFSYFRPENLMFTAVSPWVKERFSLSPIVNRYDCKVVLNGLDVRRFYPQENDTILERIGASEFLLHVTASFNPKSKDDVKGGCYLLELAKAMPERRFVVVATNVISADTLPTNVYVWGRATNQKELAELYSAARLTILVSRRETFSMVTAESLCCGTPVVGFKAGGPETIAIQEYSQFVDQGNVEGLSKAVNDMLTKVFDREVISNQAREKYSPATMAKEYLKVYNEILKR